MPHAPSQNQPGEFIAHSELPRDKYKQGKHNSADVTPLETPITNETIQSKESVSSSWLSITDRWFLLVMLTLGFVLGLSNWIRLSSWGLQPVEIVLLDNKPYSYQVDLNQANWLELMLLDGIGETLAKRIVEYRNQNGPFQHVDDLLNIKGIGHKRLDKLRSQVTCQSQSVRQSDE